MKTQQEIRSGSSSLLIVIILLLIIGILGVVFLAYRSTKPGDKGVNSVVNTKGVNEPPQTPLPLTLVDVTEGVVTTTPTHPSILLGGMLDTGELLTFGTITNGRYQDGERSSAAIPVVVEVSGGHASMFLTYVDENNQYFHICIPESFTTTSHRYYIDQQGSSHEEANFEKRLSPSCTTVAKKSFAPSSINSASQDPSWTGKNVDTVTLTRANVVMGTYNAKKGEIFFSGSKVEATNDAPLTFRLTRTDTRYDETTLVSSTWIIDYNRDPQTQLAKKISICFPVTTFTRDLQGPNTWKPVSYFVDNDGAVYTDALLTKAAPCTERAQRQQ